MSEQKRYTSSLKLAYHPKIGVLKKLSNNISARSGKKVIRGKPAR